MVYFFFMWVIIIILISFLYMIWRDEEKIKDIQTKKALYEWDIINDIKKSSVEQTSFKLWLKNLEIVNEDFFLLKRELSKKIVWMNEFINAILVNILVWGHILVEGVPWLAKTKTIDTLSKLLDMQSKRVQFTPDMLPSDIIWVEIFNSKASDFEVKKWPIFANILLADEINRTTPKVQSALLEAMQEHKVTIGNYDFQLPKPFFVLATQNPIEQEWTYSLPEAQVDRFLFKVLVDYPSVDEEKEMLNVLENEQSIILNKILDVNSVIEYQEKVKLVTISDDVKDYIVRLISKTREKNDNVIYWASPRASIWLMMWAKALAFLQWRDYVTHEDVQKLALTVLRHRVILSYDAKVDWISEDQFLVDILSKVTLE